MTSPGERLAWSRLSEIEALRSILDKEEDSPTAVRDLENATLRRPSVLYAANHALASWARGCCYDSRATKYRRRARRWLPLAIRLCFSDLGHMLLVERTKRTDHD